LRKAISVLLLSTALALAAVSPFAKEVIEKSYEATDRLPGYSVRLNYPRCQAAYSFLRRQEGEFTQILDGLKDPKTPPSLQIDYDIVYADAHLVSVYFHGSKEFGDGKTRKLQKALLLTPKGGEMTLDKEFRAGGGWINALADYCTAELQKKGVTPPPLSRFHFQTVLPQADGLRVIFEEYTVATEAYELLVPWTVVKNHILPNGCLAFAL